MLTLIVLHDQFKFKNSCLWFCYSMVLNNINKKLSYCCDSRSYCEQRR